MGDGVASGASDQLVRDDPASERRADRRRVASGLADLAVRRADAIASLDRAVEARLGDLDRAFAVRRSNLDARFQASEARLGELAEEAESELQRAGSGERRLLMEAVAGELAAVEGIVAEYRRQLRALAGAQHALLQELTARVAELEVAVGSLGPRPSRSSVDEAGPP